METICETLLGGIIGMGIGGVILYYMLKFLNKYDN